MLAEGRGSRAAWVACTAALLLVLLACATAEEPKEAGIADKLTKAAGVIQDKAASPEATPEGPAGDGAGEAADLEGPPDDPEGGGEEDEAGEGDGDEGLEGVEIEVEVEGGMDDGGAGEEEDAAASLAEMADERAYFDSLDADKDGAISMEEFGQHMKSVAEEMEKEDGDDNNGPGRLGRAVGMEWLELHDGDSHEHAFAGVDTNQNKKLSWKEWVGELFHEMPQRPSYVDGELGPVMDESMFEGHDKDGSGFLEKPEIDEFVGQYMRREEVDEEFAGNHGEEVPKESGNTGYMYLFLFEFDANFDGKVSKEEWAAGFAKEAQGPPEGSILLS